MLLAIDSGNTNIVFALLDDAGSLRAKWRASTKLDRTKDEMAVWLLSLMELAGFRREDVSAAIIATVVPASLFPLKGLCQDYFGTTPLLVEPSEIDVGVVVKMDRPEEVGADRLVNAVAAFHKYGGPLVIVDFGTATTFDVIDAEGAYLGGVIAPGVNLSLDALYRAAAKLPLVDIARPERVTGRNTVEAMRSGIYWGYVGLIDGVVARLREEHGSDFTVIATGGLASMFIGACDAIETVDADLTLDGLYRLYRLNSR